MTNEQQALLKGLPKVDVLLEQPWAVQLERSVSRQAVKKAVQQVLQDVRTAIVSGRQEEGLAAQEWEGLVQQVLSRQYAPHLRKVINATGTVLHTNLGRALLSRKAAEYAASVASSYSNLEYDLDQGKRGTRYRHVQELLCQLTGAEDVLVVNNNAAAVLLVLSTLAPGREIVISRGELVEIGGMFRIPDVIERSGGVIREVGTTNKAHLRDYADAITEQTGAVMKVHTSNYRIIGFTESVPMADLAALAHRQGLPFINDLGSGLLWDMQKLGLPYEPTVRETIQQGCDVVTFSGDKLLGGPQAGIIVGKAKYIEPMKKNQLLRALRVDKMTLAALEITLQAYAKEREIEEIPTLSMLAQNEDDCRAKAETLAAALRAIDPSCSAETVPCEDMVGGGAYPEYMLPGYMTVFSDGHTPADVWEQQLRRQDTPVIARVQKHCLAFSARTIAEADIPHIVQVMTELYGKQKKY